MDRELFDLIAAFMQGELTAALGIADRLEELGECPDELRASVREDATQITNSIHFSVVWCHKTNLEKTLAHVFAEHVTKEALRRKAQEESHG